MMMGEILAPQPSQQTCCYGKYSTCARLPPIPVCASFRSCKLTLIKFRLVLFWRKREKTSASMLVEILATVQEDSTNDIDNSKKIESIQLGSKQGHAE
mmetsp:Transcript_15663/g.35931  ORF Transcript_15663/g.35931 Transcript_15663/m.35931 type:complete len:98 (-) Transcript_15663:845-1138(-)